MDLADDFPMLASLVEHRLGGQRKLPMYRSSAAPDAHSVIAASIGAARQRNGSGASALPEAGIGEPSPPGEIQQSGKEKDQPAQTDIALPSTGGIRRPARYGLAIQFESRSEDAELARLVESTVWINEAHPAFRRAVASRSEGYHLALAVAMALGPLAVPPAEEHNFITAVLSRWGEAVEKTASRRSAR